MSKLYLLRTFWPFYGVLFSAALLLNPPEGSCDPLPVPTTETIARGDTGLVASPARPFCTPPTPANGTPELLSCANPSNGNTDWVPADADTQIDPGAGNGYVISYHPTEQSATDATSPITGIVSAPTDQVIYARIEDGNDPSCFVTIPVMLIVVTPPVATAPADPLLVCYSISPFSYTADFATLENQITGGTGEPVVYYREAAANMVLDPDNLSTGDLFFLLSLPDPPTVYARIEPVAGCPSATVPVSGLFEAYPTASPASLSSCDDGSGQGTFDLTSLDATVTGGSGNSVTYYSDAAATNAITTPAAYPSTGGTIYATVLGTNCASAPVDISLTVLGTTATIAIENGIDCPGSNTGELTVTTPGADPADLSYAWTPAALGDTENPTGLTAGTYTVVVTNTATGCSSVPVSETLSDPAAVTSACVVNQDVLTPGGSEGIIGLDISGGTAPYGLNWNSPTGSSGSMSGVGGGIFSIVNLAAGTYTVVIEDANGCPFTCSDLVVSGLACTISLSFTVAPVNCAGASDGSIQLDVANGTAPYTVDWSGPASGSQGGLSDPSYTILDLPAGVYTLTVTDGTGCTVTETVTLTDNSSGSPVEISNCVNLPQPENGTIRSYTFTLGGGTPLSGSEPIFIVDVYDDAGNLNFSFNSTTVGADLNPGTYFYNQNPVPRGTYTLIATDEYGCRDTCLITIDPVCPYDFVASYTVTPATCNNGGASIQLDSDNGVLENGTALTYQWSGGLSGSNPQDVPPGTYSVTISDYYCDIVLDNIVVAELVALEPLVCAVELEPSTLTSDDGQIRIDWTGGTPPFDLSWTGPNGTSDQYLINAGNTTVFNGLGGVGTYEITLEDASGCVQTCSVTLVGPPCPVMIAFCQGVDATAPNADDGALQVVLLDQADPWVLTYTGTDTDGNPVSGTLSDIFGPVGEVLNLPPGSYDILVTDGLDCELTCGPISIAEPPCTLSATATAIAATCAGAADGRIDLTVTGAFGAVTYDWSDNTLDGQEDPGGLAAGTYTVNLTDAAGCTFGPLAVTVTQPSGLALTCSGGGVSTVGGNDGTIDLNATGGTGPYTATWTGPGAGSSPIFSGSLVITDLSAGSYSITLTDANGCTTNCSAQVGEPGCNLSATATGTPPSCFGGSDGSISLAVTGANGAVTYDWTDDALDGQQNPSGLTAGVYTVNLTDAAGCVFGPLSVTLDQPALLDLGCVPTNPATVGGNEGAITLVLTGGAAPYSAGWTGPVAGSLPAVSSNDVIDNLPAGTYQITLTDANGCVATCTQTLIAPSCNLSATFVETNPACFGAADGAVALTVTGANGALTYDWSDDALDGQENPAGLVAGTYSVAIGDASGCATSLDITLVDPAALTAAATATATSCAGANDGTITVTPAGGTPPYTTIWAEAGFDPLQAPAGTHGFTLTDAAGCAFSGSATVPEPAALTLACASTPVSTVGGSDGTGRISPTGGTAPYTIEWSDASGPLDSETGFAGATFEITGLSPGAYQVIATDANGCTQACGFTINQPGCDLMVTAVAANPTCAGTNDGAIGLVVSGTAQPFSFDWNVDALDGQEDPQGLEPGTYTVTVSDGNGCTEVRNFTLIAPAALQLNCQATDETTTGAADGQVTLTFSGGTPPYTLAGDLGTQAAATSPLTFADLAPGTYDVLLTDANGCNQSCSPVVAPAAGCPPIDVAALATPADCPGSATGAIAVNADGGTAPYTITWAGGALTGFNPTGLLAGTYFYTVTDANGCEADGEAIVTTAATAPTLALAAPPAGICYTGCAEATFDLAGTPPFSLNYTYTSGAGSGTETVTFAGTTGSWTLCPDELGLTTLAGVSLELVEIADANCATPVGLGLVLPVSPPVVSEVTGTYCADTILLIAGESFDRDRPAGQVVLPGASAQGCDSTVTVNLTFLADPVPGEVSVSLCPGDSTVVHGRVFRAGEPGATVRLPGGSAAGCDSLVRVTVTTLPPAEGTFTAAACPGDTVFVAGRPFTVDDPDGIVVLPGGATGGCDSLIAVVVTFAGSEGVVLSGAETICPGESATLFLSYDGPGMVDVVLVDENGQTQLVSNVDNNTPVLVTPSASRRYRIQSIIGGDGTCPPFGTGEATVVVSKLSVAIRESDAGGGISCAGATDGILIASATSGIAPYTFAWSTGAATASLTGLAEGTYTVTVTDGAGCGREESYTLVAPPPLISEIVGLAPGCNAEQGLIRIDRVAGGSGDYAFALDGASFTPINALPFSRRVTPGDYAVFLVDGNGCRDTVTVRVPTGDAAVLALPPDTTILLGDSIRIVGQTSLSPDAILWTPAGGFSSQNGLSIVANPLETTVYRLEVRDAAGCVQRASVTVFVDREATLYAPTGFSPNEDGRNDVFRLYSGPGVERIETFQIFNRWGEAVYQGGPFAPFDPNWGWDGRYRGETMNPAVFVYRAVVRLVDGREVVFQGDLTLLR